MLCKRLSVAMVRDPWQPSLTLPPPFPLCYSFLSSHTQELWSAGETDRLKDRERVTGGQPISVHLNKLLTSPTVHLSFPPVCSEGPRTAFTSCACIDPDQYAAAETDLRASRDPLTDSLLLKFKTEENASNTLDFCRKNGC